LIVKISIKIQSLSMDKEVQHQFHVSNVLA